MTNPTAADGAAQRMGLVVDTGFCSESGERPDNQDYVGAFVGDGRDPLVIVAVADGVGGENGGRVAAELAVREFIEGCTGATEATAKAVAIRSLEAINQWLHAIGRTEQALKGMSCTFTGLLCIGRKAHLVHAGDSRLYRLRGDSFEQLTLDHTAGPGMRHVLTRAVGAEQSLRIDYAVMPNEPFDRYLLCTDGVHGGVGERTLQAMLGLRAAAAETARDIVRKALATPVGDNATALVLDVLGVPRPGEPEITGALGAAALLPPPANGALVDGFRLDAVLADGRYVRVFRATDQTTGQKVVLKFPKPIVGAEGPIREAFLREARIAARINSPFVGSVLEIAPERPSQLYLALPFYDGETLERRLLRRPMSLPAGLDIARKLGTGVAALHRAGIIHRDIKPDNVIVEPFVRNKGTGLKLIDFGVARPLHAGEQPGTPQPGTPSYMAPELFDGKPADEKTDQFALGVTIYRLFTGRFPYGEIEPFSHPRFRAHAPIAASRPDLPSWLDRAIGRAIAVRPDARYDDVLEFVFELEHGADRASPIEIERKPFYDRNPLLFWKVVSALLALLLVASLLIPRGTGRPSPAQGGAEVQRNR